MAGAVHSTVEVHPGTAYFEIRLIGAPGIVSGFELSTHTLFELGSVVLDPAIDGGVVDMEAALDHHLLKVTIA
jgi:hypothetical protein